MSSPLAIASVTHALRNLLQEGLNQSEISHLVMEVTTHKPDKMESEGANINNGLNLYLYMVTPNQGWRNHAFPSHNARGDRISSPPLALDLHYMLNPYGTGGLGLEMVMGVALQALHEMPVLARQDIRAYLEQDLSDMFPNNPFLLSTSGLAEQIEQIKISPESLNTEEITRLWTAFGAKYQLCAFYKASVLLIESKKSKKAALPVKESKVYVQPFIQPVIHEVSSIAPDETIPQKLQKILPGHSLVIKGSNLKGSLTSVFLSGIEVGQNDFTTFNSQQIAFPVPTTLKAGIHGVQVIQKLMMGDPATVHTGSSSNVEAIVLSPEINGVNLVMIQLDDADQRALEISCSPEIGEDQQVTLFLNEIEVDLATATPKNYSFEYLPGVESPMGTITIPIFGVGPGKYLVRIRVDNGESPIATDYQSPSITFSE